ncbi:hypothetical protein BB560_003528 [Smittium megazygosporum]|uniref:Proline dehydrogenase n=1 Tax=Smittium megazygosporum TaxID=133381 RepID=A0A2T9ZBP8_9FUNG|nr:hypothetical protein BB560_003528 [Smittium megazygosporum]
MTKNLLFTIGSNHAKSKLALPGPAARHNLRSYRQETPSQKPRAESNVANIIDHPLNKTVPSSRFNLSESKEHLIHANMSDLIRAAFVYKCCTMPWLVELSPKLIDFANKAHLNIISDPIVKKTFFQTFCAGENKPEVQATMRKLESVGIKSIVDLSVESDLNISDLLDSSPSSPSATKSITTDHATLRKIQNEKADLLVNEYINSVDIASSQENSFAAIKVTGFIPPAAMFRLSLSYLSISRVLTDAFESTKNSSLNYSLFVDLFYKKLPAFTSGKLSNNDLEAHSKKVFEFFDTDKDGLVDKVDIEIGMNLENHVVRDLYLSDQIDIAFAYKESSPDTNSRPAVVKGGVNQTDFDDFDLMLKRMDSLATHAKNLNVQLMFDAEHSYFQPVIDMCALSTMKKFNSFGSASKTDPSSDYFQAKPLVLNTYQMYTKSALGRLKSDFEKSSRQNWAFGAKLVRGAYMDLERNLSKKYGYYSPINDTISKTHLSYNSGVQFMLSNVEKKQLEMDAVLSKGPENKDSNNETIAKNPALFIASHNQESIEVVLNELSSRNIHTKARTVSFAQLLGMQDATSYKLAELNANIYKYVPYGPMRETLPYLIRRAQENSSILEAAALEVKSINQEILNRIKSLF